MTVLILGGTGSTGLKLAHLLRNANIPVLITSRSGVAPDGFPAVRFDWSDSTTFSAPFQTEHQIDKIYFIGPRVQDMISAVKPFVDLAIEKGVKQWVLVGGTSAQKGGHGMGGVYGYLDDKGVDHAILRPTWFSDNFATQYTYSIKTKNEFVSAAGNGRIPFVASDDIAQAGFDLLTTESKELRNLNRTSLARTSHLRRGLPQSIADFVTALNVRTASGTEEVSFNAEDRKDIKYVGKKTLREFFEENKDVWVSA
ncbi:NADH(P)-binding-domain-containing protein [Cyathus striatus]|nr:NADH(P)-binding-domain-containing protein [Cyathus striatus]